ncbi:hypothetical protein BKP37_09615 [Anaerobacillus alkalilacustris]|uniref:Uncharacterized protein n=1 Tax=Anaerobacillus alkalilacustris TaxID=393763 RepID=A0A1S2LLY3_9BACI|nr:hypothetical protein [Anaerobacillus alkalilacustris]OIJ13538.1 hypothetical protein BKP37_09615 [Anaerobacillus alkalilacustris]
MTWSETDSENLAKAVSLLDELVSLVKGGNTINQHPPVASHSGQNLEQELFEKITDVYVDEEILKQAKSLKRKSGQRVSKNLTQVLVNFFAKILPNLQVSSHNQYVLFQKDNQPVALLRFQTDLGYTRGDVWYDHIQDVVNEAASIGVNSDRVFIMVGSMINSLDNAYIQDVLQQKGIPDNSELLSNKHKILFENFLKKYVANIPHLPNPEQQVFFLAKDVHPNPISFEIVSKNKAHPNITNFIDPSVTDLHEVLSNI